LIKRILYSTAIILALASCTDKHTLPKFNVDIIPRPQEVKQTDGAIPLTGTFSITSPISLEKAKTELASFLKSRVKISLSTKSNNEIEFLLDIDSTSSFQDEGYRLDITENKVSLTSSGEEGIWRGLATLKQLTLLNAKEGNHFLPCLQIEDWPNFQHRGLLLDCSRHFFEVDVIKKYIDLLAFYKMNTIHWHLTEDQGWRIAIDKYPKLTSIGAFRTESDGSIYGGYYSKKDIKEIVAYAASKHIEVIPEIEMPGHSQAAIAAYPHLSCTGESVPVANDWGVFKEIYCAGNDSVFVFLEDVLTEVMELFPSEYIHIGGDEAPKVRWEECEKCQHRIDEEGLADEAELQSYFIQRVQKFLNQNGRQIIGWDEILEGGLTQDAIVQSWRGMEGGIEAVRQGNMAIMSPTSHAYFDYGLDAIDLKKVYDFNPVPKGLSPQEQKRIIGGECNMWTERVPDEKTLDSRVFPRLLAMAEVLWSDSTSRDYSEFVDRVQSHYPILKNKGVQYGKESVAMTHEMKLRGEESYLRLLPYSEAISLKYAYRCQDCDNPETEYSDLIPIQESGIIAVQPYRNNAPYGDSILIPVSNHQAINATVTYANPYSKWYTAGGESGLVDGLLGTLNFRDGAWQGFWGNDLETTIELKRDSEISSVTAHFYQYNNSWIFIPTEMKVEVSTDGKMWKNWGAVASRNDPKRRGKYIQSIQIAVDRPEVVNFIRLSAKNIGKVPDWHEAAGADAWIFIDEIIAK